MRALKTMAPYAKIIWTWAAWVIAYVFTVFLAQLAMASPWATHHPLRHVAIVGALVVILYRLVPSGLRQ